MKPSYLPEFLLSEPDPDKGLTADEIRAIHDSLGELVALLPEPGLTGKDRKALAVYLFLQGPLLVLKVVSAMRREPGLFADDPVRGEDLDARLDRSFVLGNLERILLTAARRANELALRDRASAVRDARAVLKRARRAEEEGQPGGYQRACSLRAAQDILDKHARLVRKGRQEQLKHQQALKEMEKAPKKP